MLYKPKDINDLVYERDLNDPGHFPFTRGVYSTMYTGRLWTMRQYAGYGTAQESNKRYRYLLEQGQTGLSVAFDLPTQMGYDSDNEFARDETGKTGVAVDTLDDMEMLFKSIPLDRVSTSMTINATAAILLAMYIVVAEKQGIAQKDLSGTVQNDILKEYIARGTYIYPPNASMKLTTDIIAYCSQHLPKWNTISVSGYHIREAGATAVQELAFTLANGIAYVQQAIEQAGLEVDVFAPRISFFFNAHNNFLEEIAKFRAGRRIWAMLMKERFHAQKPKSWMLRFHTQTAGCTLTAQEPQNNAIRVAFQALAAVLGGTQSLHTNSRDEALSLPSEESVKLALRTQQIIAYESGIPSVVDPFGGSYCIEHLTGDIEEQVYEYLEKIDELGGAMQAVETGFFQSEIHKSAYQYQQAIEKGDVNVVGVNTFGDQTVKKQFSVLKISPTVVTEQMRKLERVKQKRNNKNVEDRIRKLKAAARAGSNLMPLIIDCVRQYASVGEISDALRSVYGTYKETNLF